MNAQAVYLFSDPRIIEELNSEMYEHFSHLSYQLGVANTPAGARVYYPDLPAEVRAEIDRLSDVVDVFRPHIKRAMEYYRGKRSDYPTPTPKMIQTARAEEIERVDLLIHNKIAAHLTRTRDALTHIPDSAFEQMDAVSEGDGSDVAEVIDSATAAQAS